jgi:hypothetical protein
MPAQLPVLVMVSAYSRWLTAMLIPSRNGSDLFAGWWALLQRLVGVPRTLAVRPVGRGLRRRRRSRGAGGVGGDQVGTSALV